MTPKERAAEAALQFVESGMVVGLGSGSTAQLFIQRLGQRLRDGTLSGIRGVPTSHDSERLAHEGGIPLTSFSEVERCDVTIDGADEVDPRLNLIKGLGGALLREKIVAQNRRQLVIIADTSKKVSVLGTRGPLPVEVLPFARETSERFLRSLGCVPELRMDGGKPYVTDNGNLIFHCRFEQIGDAVSLDRKLHSRAGIVETGLFIDLATTVVLAGPDSVEIRHRGETR
jgi:ribose 5-phosphate isomerase A